MIQASSSLYQPFSCVDSTGTPTAPTGTPTGTLVKNGTDLGTTVTVTMSTAQGVAVCTIPSDAVAGDRFWIRISAVISGTTYIGSGPAAVCGPVPVNVTQISGDSAAADNLEAACDGTGYNLGNGSIVAASVTGAVGSVTGAVGSVTGNIGGNLNGNVAGNLAGSVGSVTGSVGSVTGSVGSVAGNVGGSVASVAGAVGSVVGNVGGDVSGKVLGGGSGTITGDGVRAASVTGAVGSVTGAVGSVTGTVGGIAGTLQTLDAVWTKVKSWLAAIAGKSADAPTLSEINATTAGATYSNLTDSLEAVRDRGDAAWTGGGGGGLTGANLITITVTDGSDPVPGAFVRLKAGAETEVKATDASGVVTFSADDNTYSVRITATNLTFESVSLAVVGDVTITYEMDPVATLDNSWATGADLVAYFDAKTIGQMLKDDNTAVDAGDVADHAIVQRMLRAASGEVDSAIRAGDRYTESQLALLNDRSLETLKAITCQLALWYLRSRRVASDPDRFAKERDNAWHNLERLRKGEIVLDLTEQREAGIAHAVEFVKTEPSLLLRDTMSGRTGVFPARRYKN